MQRGAVGAARRRVGRALGHHVAVHQYGRSVVRLDRRLLVASELPVPALHGRVVDAPPDVRVGARVLQHLPHAIGRSQVDAPVLPVVVAEANAAPTVVFGDVPHVQHVKVAAEVAQAVVRVWVQTAPVKGGQIVHVDAIRVRVLVATVACVAVDRPPRVLRVHGAVGEQRSSLGAQHAIKVTEKLGEHAVLLSPRHPRRRQVLEAA